jgi:hypothetical protein
MVGYFQEATDHRLTPLRLTRLVSDSKPQRRAETPAIAEPNASCDIRVTISRAAGIIDRPALRRKNTSSTAIFGVGWNARPPPSDLRVTTRA